MEEFLAPALDQRGAFVRQVDDLLEVEAGRMVIGEGREIGEFRLADNILGAWVVEEHIVHDTAPPHHHSVLTSKAGISDERMAAAVPVVGVIVCAEVVLLRKERC